MWYCQLKILVIFPFLGGFHLLLHSIDHCLSIERYIHRLRKAEESMALSKMLLFRAKLEHISFLIFFAYLSFSFNSDDPSLLALKATIVSDPPKVLNIWLEHDLVSSLGWDLLQLYEPSSLHFSFEDMFVVVFVDVIGRDDGIGIFRRSIDKSPMHPIKNSRFISIYELLDNCSQS